MDFFSDCKNDEQAKSTFKLLTMMFHPDKGGNKDLMVELNRQYNAFKSPSIDNFFNKINRGGFRQDGNIPFDHPIHQQIKGFEREIERLNVVIYNLKTDYTNQIENLKIKCNHITSGARTNYQENVNLRNRLNDIEMDKNKEIKQLEDDICALCDVYESTPKTLWEFIKRIFE